MPVDIQQCSRLDTVVKARFYYIKNVSYLCSACIFHFLRTHGSVKKAFLFTHVFLLAYIRHMCKYFLVLASVGNVTICWRSDQTSNFIHYPTNEKCYSLENIHFFYFWSCWLVRVHMLGGSLMTIDPSDKGYSQRQQWQHHISCQFKLWTKTNETHTNAIPNFISKVHFLVFGFKVVQCHVFKPVKHVDVITMLARVTFGSK